MTADWVRTVTAMVQGPTWSGPPLASAQAVLTAVVHNAGLGIALVAPDGVPFQINPALAELLGYSEQELLTVPYTRYTHPDDLAVDAALFDQVRAGTRDHYRLDKRYVRKDHVVVWVSLTVSAVRDDAGALLFVVGMAEDVTARRHHTDALQHQATHDGLTDLPNRTALTGRLQQLGRSQRAGDTSSVAVFFLDLDDFKMINDTHGHDVGDHVLKIVADRLRSATRDSDLLVRLGGDEFVVVATGLTGELEAVAYAERLLNALAPVVLVDGRPVSPRASVGVALSPGDDSDVEVLLRNADVAMLRAKADGAGQLALHTSVIGPRRVPTSALPDLRHALESGQVHPQFQPVVDLATGHVIGAEALARWTLPDGTTVAPSLFINFAERTGLIGPLDRLVMHETAAALTRGPLQTLAGCSVNASPLQITSGLIVDEVHEVLQQSGLDPGRLTVELTETAVLGDPGAARRHLQTLKTMGVRIALDDFGTGYSSLSHLAELPIDVVKLDRAFVSRIDHSPHAREISRAVIALAAALSMTVIAEGVETPAQNSVLLELGCQYAQGFLHGHPVPASQFAQLHLPGAPAQQGQDPAR